ncbi:tetratricopeptide repeat protein [Desulfosporosinus acidiphilus SJ4]|uniref:Tetratricopeptide repeat protein n=1 Tax=Desulfosporosinus acidiphilus (strain DSM 22704 / JCM 16185 / SJ4) TaxID=646529 RepID=I4D8C4_DESAJ|nr:tetratricopeptide repeat protein [Desulfosporosinus acidiphilus]AFM42048.1 tetratricopeptide repeat protein [Desulfosporosinus acidiphilus SJ4]
MSKTTVLNTFLILTVFITFCITFCITSYYDYSEVNTSTFEQKSIEISHPQSSPAQLASPISISDSNPPPIHSSDPKALTLYEEGLKLYYQRRFSQALELFNKSLTIDPLCYEALNGKGATQAYLGNYNQGLALIQQALDLNPAYVYGNFNRGLAFELAGQWDEAIAAYQKTLQLDKNDTWSYYGIASIYGRLGNINKVVEYLQQAIALDPDVKEVAREEKDFAPVREYPRFQALIAP